jgi:hypothetical protein
MSSLSQIERVIRGYERDGDALLIEIVLSNWSDDDEAHFRHAFQLQAEDPGYDCYPLGRSLFLRMQARFGELATVRFEDLDYFIETQVRPLST